ncbi:MAG: hypothetical protein Q8O37_13890 [Sulfuricellaceae bacterium]|nr:hypothetical protein [Sulfuricellaceae bacterium]
MTQSTARQYGGSKIEDGTGNLPPAVIVSAAFAFLVFGLGPNAVLAAGSLLVLLVILALFWRPGEPPVLVYVFVFQWLEASVWVFYANLHDLPIDDGTTIGADRHLATVLLLVGILVQSVGARLSIGAWRIRDRQLAELQLRRYSQDTWFKLYLASLAVAAGAGFLARLIPPLSQPLLALVYVKWAAYVIFTFATFFRSDTNKGLWLLVFSLELLFSLGDYFSSFKFVFLFTFLGVFAAEVRFSARLKVMITAVVFLALFFGAIWSAIKGDYRYFVSGGKQAQVVEVDFPERIAKLTELTTNLDGADVLDGFDTLLKRIEYVEYFGDVTNYVPAVLPHTNGERWLDAIMRPFMPRLLFPDKSVIDESYLTNRFTGLYVAGMDEGTQISLGYMAETYIDFGQYAMMPVLFLWGLFLGWVYRWLMQSENSRGVLGMGFACAILVMTSSSIGNSLAKLVGGLVVSLLVAWLFNRIVVPRWLPWLRA